MMNFMNLRDANVILDSFKVDHRSYFSVLRWKCDEEIKRAAKLGKRQVSFTIPDHFSEYGIDNIMCFNKLDLKIELIRSLEASGFEVNEVGDFELNIQISVLEPRNWYKGLFSDFDKGDVTASLRRRTVSFSSPIVRREISTSCASPASSSSSACAPLLHSSSIKDIRGVSSGNCSIGMHAESLPPSVRKPRKSSIVTFSSGPKTDVSVWDRCNAQTICDSFNQEAQE